jgi:ElaB/YqjD/DUF883 family membrane-anchored ribosome-binding protein
MNFLRKCEEAGLDGDSAGDGDAGASILTGGDSGDSNGVDDNNVGHTGIESDGGEGNGDDAAVAWMSGLDKELQSDPSLLKFENVGALAKSYQHLQKMVGKDKLTIPDKHAVDDDWKALFNKLGQPEKFEDYHLDVDKGADFEDGFITQFKEAAFNNNIMPKQAEALLKWYSQANTESNEAYAQRQEEQAQQALNEMRKELGGTYERQMQRLRHAVKHAGNALGEEQLFGWLNNSEIDGTTLGSHPMMLKLINHFTGLMAEDTFVGANIEAGESVKTIQDDIDTIMKNPAHPYFDKKHPEHNNAVKDVKRKFELLHPDQKKDLFAY